MLKSREELLETEVALVPPDGGTGEGPLLVGSEFHPDEENQRKIAACLADNPIPGVELLPFHPLAASEELRYVHRAQLSEWFTGNLEARTSGDPDEAAAGWVSPEVTEINPWLLVVLHDPVKGRGSYAVVGPRATQAALGFACELGLKNIVIDDIFLFTRSVLRAIQLEIDAIEGNELAQGPVFHEKLKHAVYLGELGLQARFRKEREDMRFLFGLCEVNYHQIDKGLLRELEAVPIPARFERPDVDADTLHALVIQACGEETADVIKSKGLQVVASTWNYIGRSDPMQDQNDGKERRRCFATLMVEGRPPECKDGEIWATFPNPLRADGAHTFSQ